MTPSHLGFSSTVKCSRSETGSGRVSKEGSVLRSGEAFSPTKVSELYFRPEERRGLDTVLEPVKVTGTTRSQRTRLPTPSTTLGGPLARVVDRVSFE